jgi:dTDP-4-amino-4,6-dideoxygalactose transaminase
MSAPSVPYHRADLGDEEIAAVTRVLRSGWLTTGPECKAFEEELAAFVGARHAVAVSSCTAALHLALEATRLERGDLVLVPSMTFAATAEVVNHLGGVPVLVDSEPDTLNLDPAHAGFLLGELAAGRPVPGVAEPRPAHAIIPVHYGGQMADVDAVAALAARHRLRVIEDAAHALPAAARGPRGWREVGTTCEQTCFSFYANKTITTGEGGMLVTDSEELAARARCMSLHGLSSDAWNRFTTNGRWDYRVVASGFKYNLTDLAAALGRVQLTRATALAAGRRRVADGYRERLGDIEELELPAERPDRRSSWHLYPLRLRLKRLTVDRAAFIDELQRLGIRASVHWRPLHLHPYYRERFGHAAGDLPVATAEWERLVSLPIFPSMTAAEQEHVAGAIRAVVVRHLRRSAAAS